MEKKQIGWILIPPQVMADRRLTQSAKVLYGKINGLTGERGYCWAGNETLAEYIGMKDIRNPLEKLIKFQYIKRVLFVKEGNVRHLYPLLPQPQTSVATATDPSVATATDTMHYDYALKKEKHSFFRNSNEAAKFERLKHQTGSTYVPNGYSPADYIADKKAMEKKLGLRKVPDKVKFMYKAGGLFLRAYELVLGIKWEGKGILRLDPVAKTLSDWFDRGMDESAVEALIVGYFKSKKAKDGVVTPTACFSEHTWQAYRQKKLK